MLTYADDARIARPSATGKALDRGLPHLNIIDRTSHFDSRTIPAYSYKCEDFQSMLLLSS